MREDVQKVGVALEQLCEGDVEAGVLPRFRHVVSAQPDAVAVADDNEELTYTQVAAAAARVLNEIQLTVAALEPSVVTAGEEAFGAKEPIATLYGHTPHAATALLGVIASGHPVLVLDPRNPAARMRQLMAQLGARVVVADQANEATALDLTSCVVVPDRDGVDVAPDLLWADPPEPDSIATVGFTSGSTGTPKSVAGDHRILVRDAWNSSIATGCYDAGDVIAHTLPIAFNAGLTTTVHGLLVGACMRLYDARGLGIAGLPDFISANACTLMISSPGILRGLAASNPDPASLRTLRNLTIAGEVAYARDIALIRPFLPDTCVVRNRYGSTETTLISEFVMSGVPDWNGPLPIGRGVGRTTLELVDEDLNPVPDGESGRVAVTAPNTTHGYWGQPDATAAVFRRHDDGSVTYRTNDLGRRLPDGSIAIVGRADHSVKIRGYLVDPGEIDAALFDLPLVREAVTVALPRPTDQRKRLVSYVVPQPGTDLDDQALRLPLRAALPPHMVPELFQIIDALPRNDRGKIDRFSLPEPVEIVPDDVTYSLWEEHVAEEWAAVLEMDRVPTPDEDFFALGGDSLAAEALIARLHANWDVSPEVATTGLLTEAPRLRDLAARLQSGVPSANGSLVTFRTDGRRDPLFFIVGGGGLGVAYNYMARQFSDRPVYAIQSPVIEGRGVPELTMRQMVRARLRVLRSVRPHGPYNLAGHSFGGLLAFEMAQQLSAAGEQVNLMILDAFAPDPSLHPPAPPAGLVERLRRKARLIKVSVRNSAGGSDWYKFFEQATNLGLRYHGKPWGGKTLVVVAQTPEKAVRSAWEPFLTGDWYMVEVAGDHRSMLRAPEADDTVAAIKGYLQEIEPPERVIDLRDPAPYTPRHAASPVGRSLARDGV